MFCANCGTKQNEGEKFCPNCGTKFEKLFYENNIVSNQKNNYEDLTDVVSINIETNSPISEQGDLTIKKINDTDNLKENGKSIKNEFNIVETKKEDKYALLWEKININGGELSLVLRENQLDSGIISDVIEEVNIDYDSEDVYKHFDEENGCFEFFYILDYRLNGTKDIINMINKYNINATSNGYEKIYLIINEKHCIVNAVLKRKNLGFWDAILSWNPEYDFKRICNLCEPLKI